MALSLLSKCPLPDRGPSHVLRNGRLAKCFDGLDRARGHGADPARNYDGELPWYGSVKEVQHRLRDLDRRRQAAEGQLADALLDDAEREKREGTAKHLNDALNALRTKISADPPYLRVVDRENDDVDESTLTPLQRQALAQARAALVAGGAR